MGGLLAEGVRARPSFRMIEMLQKITFLGSSPGPVCSLCLTQQSLQPHAGRGSEQPGLRLLSASPRPSAVSLPTHLVGETGGADRRVAMGKKKKAPVCFTIGNICLEKVAFNRGTAASGYSTMTNRWPAVICVSMAGVQIEEL